MYHHVPIFPFSSIAIWGVNPPFSEAMSHESHEIPWNQIKSPWNPHEIPMKPLFLRHSRPVPPDRTYFGTALVRWSALPVPPREQSPRSWRKTREVAVEKWTFYGKIGSTWWWHGIKHRISWDLKGVNADFMGFKRSFNADFMGFMGYDVMNQLDVMLWSWDVFHYPASKNDFCWVWCIKIKE